MPLKKLTGKAWVFQGLIDVDRDILPNKAVRDLRARQVHLTEETTAKYAMTTLDPEFPGKVNKGDFVVGGENVGYGNDHDRASMALKGAGVGAVICESTNGNFFRNSIEWGLPVVECPGIMGHVKQGDELEVDLASGVVRNLATGAQLPFPPYPDFLLEMIEAGGLYPHLKRQLEAGSI